MTVLVAVCGASPGTGKSTLCAGLSAWLAGAGASVDHFREEEILTRPRFAPVAEEFSSTGRVTLGALLTSTARFVDAALERGDQVVVADALMPYVPTVLAMGHDGEAIDGFAADLERVLAPLHPVMVFLDGDAGVALSRAAAREEPGWLDWYLGRLARYEVSPRVQDLASALRYLERERATTLRVAARHGWRLALVGRASELTPQQVLDEARRLLSPWLPYRDPEDTSARRRSR